MNKLAVIMFFISVAAYAAPDHNLSPQMLEFYRKKFDELSANLPSGINAKDVIGLIAPGRDATRAIQLEVKPWRYKDDAYLAYVSFSIDADKYDSSGYNEDPSYLGVVEYASTNPGIKLIARTAGPVELVASIVEKEEHRFGGISRFDLAPYKINDKEVAFGIRFTMHTAYGGGGSETEYLALFRIEEDRVINILTEPISSHSDIAGDWHEDDTRGRSSSETYYVLSVLKHTTQGYNDLRINDKNGRLKRTFVWSSEANRYIKLK